VIVGHHLHQEGDGPVRLGDHAGPGKGPAQRGERDEHEVVAGAQVGALVLEHGGQFGGSEQVQRADAHDDLRPQAGQAVGRRGREVHDEGTGCLRVAMGEQGEQGPLPAPGMNHGRERHDEHPPQHGEQGDAGREADDLHDGEQERLLGAGELPPGQFPRDGQRAAHDSRVLAVNADREERPDCGEAAGQPERLPQQDRGRRGPARPCRA
jgi:hypothetical protein